MSAVSGGVRREAAAEKPQNIVRLHRHSSTSDAPVARDFAGG
jgi:hypothetical protein